MVGVKVRFHFLPLPLCIGLCVALGAAILPWIESSFRKKSDTMATVEKLGGNWVIVRGDRVNESDETSGSLAAQETVSLPTREFWAGDRWVGQYGFAKQFATMEEAETYIAQHRNEIA